MNSDFFAGLWFVFSMLSLPAVVGLFIALCFRLANADPADAGVRMPSRSTYFRAVLVALGIAVLTSCAGLILVRTKFEDYGWSLFLGLPVLVGVAGSLAFNFKRIYSLRETVLTANISGFISSLAFLLTGLEGLICVFMALPLVLPMASAGAYAGWLIRRTMLSRSPAFPAAACLALIPLLMYAENKAGIAPELIEVTSEITIAAPPEKVWQHVVSFSDLPANQDWVFKTGIAYPLRAEIQGEGVGAVRHCVFSTGPFVEPIVVWDAPRLLRFGVTSQPPVMQELSPYRDLVPPHVANEHLRSRAGQFRLIPTPDGGTRLVGTTWYELKFAPVAYWKLWSDALIHRIHMRVLTHIKAEAEKD